MEQSGTGATIGIVTALAVECAAMRELIDELTEPPAPDGDPNDYRAGWLPSREPGRPHRVVLTVQARDGTRAAAALCTDLVRSFPGVRCVIMCGIAGGVPAPDRPERHARLGDVVVATGGVVDYDHVRTVDGKNRLRRPTEGLSRTLLRADRELQVKEFSGEWPWRPLLDRVAGANGGGFTGGFARPHEDTDRLFAAGRRIGHPDPDRSGHGDGWPRIHRGAIGSADRLLRDARLRDALARRHGVCAMEMESSGIAVGAQSHAVEWFVVRGIADYCDNVAKSDLWHPFASLAAAAYVRALLAECRPFAVRRGRVEPPIDPSGADLRAIVDGLLGIEQMRDDYGRRAILRLLPPYIRAMIADSVHGRVHVVATVQACLAFDDGRDALLDALSLALAAESAELRRAVEAITRNWPAG